MTHSFRYLSVEGETYTVFVNNENIVTWRNGELDAMSPDYIYNLNPETGEAATSDSGIGGYNLGEEVVLIGVPAPAQWRTQAGIEPMGPRHFGFDFDWIPLEDLQGE